MARRICSSSVMTIDRPRFLFPGPPPSRAPARPPAAPPAAPPRPPPRAAPPAGRDRGGAARAPPLRAVGVAGEVGEAAAGAGRWSDWRAASKAVHSRCISSISSCAPAPSCTSPAPPRSRRPVPAGAASRPGQRAVRVPRHRTRGCCARTRPAGVGAGAPGRACGGRGVRGARAGAGGPAGAGGAGRRGERRSGPEGRGAGGRPGPAGPGREGVGGMREARWGEGCVDERGRG
jgi:hypothetical protein